MSIGCLYKKEAVNILLRRESSYLLQLRDFDSCIDYPGQWGAFGGGMKLNENIYSAARRELDEELHFTSERIRKVRTYLLEKHYVHVCICELTVPLSELTLSEGVDMGLFRKEELVQNCLYSQKLQKYFPIAPPLMKFFKDLNIT